MKLIKSVIIHDGGHREINNKKCMFIEEKDRASKIMQILVNDGWNILSVNLVTTPAIQEQGNYTFYMGGYDVLFEKEVDDIQEDNFDQMMKKALRAVGIHSDNWDEYEGYVEDEFFDDEF